MCALTEQARETCLLRHLVGDALVCYGLPVRVSM